MKKNNLIKIKNTEFNNSKIINFYADLNELDLYREYPEILKKLLGDNTTKKYLLGCSTLYSSLGKGYNFNDEMFPELVVANVGKIIKPRILKTKLEQKIRTREMAEVFTPAGICNKQNNLIDNKGFNSNDIFNREINDSGITNKRKIVFENKTWESYVLNKRLEITCGEGPYIVSRYDVVNKTCILPNERIGFLDRKIRVINENISDEKSGFSGVKKAFQNSYGFDFQGDNVLLARENLLLTFIDYYGFKFNKFPREEQLMEIVDIISGNIGQMDAFQYTIPVINKENKKHVYCFIFDGEKNKKIKFVDLIGEMKNE